MEVKTREDYEKLSMELVTFAKDELERRRKAPILVSAEEVARQMEIYRHILIYDPRIGSNQKSFRFWKGKVDAKRPAMKHLGHRHTVEAVIYVEGGEGYSVIDGKDYHWKPGDFLCVPVFAWHRHQVTKGDHMIYFAATTGPLSMYLGIAIYEDERYPEQWVFAQKGEEELRGLIPGKSGVPDGSTKVVFGSGEAKPRSRTDEIYFNTLNFAEKEENNRRLGKVLVRWEDLKFEPTQMGSVALVVDPAVGFHVRTLGTLVAEIPAEKRSGAHRHVYEETNYVISGRGYSIIEDQRYDWKKGDSLCIPLFAWHQHFNTGKEPAQFLVHHNRPYQENTGFLMVQHGEDANY